jgi:hypothetical protein
VTVLTVDVHHLEVDHLDAVVLDQLENVLHSFCHKFIPLFKVWGSYPFIVSLLHARVNNARAPFAAKFILQRCFFEKSKRRLTGARDICLLLAAICVIL